MTHWLQYLNWIRTLCQQFCTSYSHRICSGHIYHLQCIYNEVHFVRRFQCNQIYNEGVVRHFLMLMSIGICILCRFYIEQSTAVCHSATTVARDQGYKRIISFSSLMLSLLINGKQSRINLNWSVRFLNNWRSYLGFGIFQLFFQACVVAAMMQKMPAGYVAQLPTHFPVLQMKIKTGRNGAVQQQGVFRECSAQCRAMVRLTFRCCSFFICSY